MERVEIVWQDAALEKEQLDLEHASSLNPITRSNVGYLVCDNKDKVIICFGIINDADKKMSCVEDSLVIPKGDVLELKRLKG